MEAFDLTSTDVCSVLLGGRMSRNGTAATCYRDGMQVFRSGGSTESVSVSFSMESATTGRNWSGRGR